MAFLPLVILPAVAILFIWMFIRKDRRHATETGKRALYEGTCGGIVGWFTYKGPFIRLAVYSEFLVVTCDRVYYLPFAEIQQIERRNFLFRKGYRIHHRNPSYPQRLEVWPGDRSAFEAAFAGKVQIG